MARPEDLLAAERELEARLESMYGGAAPTSMLRARVMRAVAAGERRQPPSLVPEVLDFVGWAAVVAFLAVLATTLPFVA